MASILMEKLLKFAVANADANTLIKIASRVKAAEGAQNSPKTIEEAMTANKDLAPYIQRYTRANNRPDIIPAPPPPPQGISLPDMPSMPTISDDSILRDIGRAVSNKYDKAINVPLQQYFNSNFDFVPENVEQSLASNKRHLNAGQRYKDLTDKDMRNMQDSQLRALNLAFKNNASPDDLNLLMETFKSQRDQANSLDSSRSAALESILSPVDLAAQERRRRQLLQSLGY